MNKFEMKDKLDGLLYQAYNFFSEIIFQLKLNTKGAIKKNLNYKETHAGERCFILGTGPSLKDLTRYQIDTLKKEIIFGTNSLYKTEITSTITPRYYALLDNLYWEQWNYTFDDIAKKYHNNPPIFITDLRARYLAEKANPSVQNIYISSKKYPVREVSDQLHKNIFAAMNVVSYSILTASYMGFKKIYLLGCDYNAFCTSGKGHAYDDKSELSETNYNLAFYLKFYCITTEFHYLIEKLARSKGVEVINLTTGSLLDAYRKERIEDVLIKN